MAKLVPIKCPNCGADMRVGAHDQTVTCGYCNTSCFVRQPGQAPPPRPPTMHAGQMYHFVDIPKAQRSAVALSAAVAILVALGVAGAVVATGLRSASVTMSGDDADVDVPARRHKDKSDFGAAGSSGKAPANPVKASDMTRVDPAELIRQAVEVAKQVEPRAKLIRGHFTELKGGLLDLTGASKGHVVFEYRWNDPSKTAGKDVVEGSFYIIADKGSFQTWAHHRNSGAASNLRDEKRAVAFPVPLPTCSGARAWAVAVTSGVPADAVSTVHWDKVSPFSADRKLQWSFRVEGHDEHRREVDAASCKLLRRWDRR